MIRLQHFAHSRLSWGLLFFSGLVLEIAALYFQYYMDYAPCVMCIYIRVAVLGIMISALIGAVNPKFWLLRFAGMLGWIISAVWGAKLAFELNEMQVNPSPFSTCSFFPEFPEFMPLDEWLPQIFSPTGMCGESVWSFLSISMVQWMIIGFVVYCFVWLLMLLPALTPKRN
ncbi:disulfide bond formation protein DsbB [Shewanella aestuarii]|uniref:Disulfide bond formation protein B n=1 Tax=Shewanella aestuarii TaxID=1028752 RepID=A0A6G9QJZ5_9GAMM|nr:disulfide bond formation protein DsbB [Shewanella aestuarii]QIR14385.1 disulfide bond formation protein DsbB [Shewanella aestuarii]